MRYLQGYKFVCFLVFSKFLQYQLQSATSVDWRLILPKLKAGFFARDA